MDVPSHIALRGVVNISSMTTTGFHVLVVKTFLAELLYREKFLLLLKTGRQKHSHSWSIWTVPALNKTPEKREFLGSVKW